MVLITIDMNIFKRLYNCKFVLLNLLYLLLFITYLETIIFPFYFPSLIESIDFSTNTCYDFTILKINIVKCGLT